MSAFNTAITSLHAALIEAVGVNITYIRGDTSITLKAVPAEATQDETQRPETGRATRSDSQDFIVLAADLVNGGAQLVPARHDRIVWNGTTYLVSPRDLDGVWRWSDQQHLRRRIHTRKQ